MPKKNEVVRTKSMRGCVNRTFTGTTIIVKDSVTGKVIDTKYSEKKIESLNPVNEMIKYAKATGNQGISVELEAINASYAMPFATFKEVARPYDPTTGEWVEVIEVEVDEADTQE